MKNTPKTFQHEAVRPSIRLPTIKLNPWPLIADGEEADSISSLAHYLAVQCITCLVDVARQRDPLNEQELTSVIWLRKNGAIELVQETNYQQRSVGDLMADSLYVEVFRSKKDVVPFSKFHEWIADENGEYVGDMNGHNHCVKPGWDKESSIAHTDAYQATVVAIDWTPFRIEPKSTTEVIGRIKKRRYREKLTERILKWILQGHYTATYDKLSLIGLKRTFRDYGMEFILRKGRDSYYRALSEKIYRLLADNACIERTFWRS